MKDTKAPLKYHISGQYDSCTLFQVFLSHVSYTVKQTKIVFTIHYLNRLLGMFIIETA